MELIGVRLVDFKAENGDKITGARLFCLGDIIEKNGSGRACENFFVSQKNLPKIPQLGSNIEPVYNKYGKVQGINVLS